MSAIAALFAIGCRSVDVAGQAYDRPMRYHEARYDLTFSLPSSWRGCSVAVRELDDQKYSLTDDKEVLVGHTPMITLRHPQWHASGPYQDIPILVFSRAQRDELHRGELWPSLFAGGVMYELWHNRRFVFAISSRYNADNEVRGWKEVAGIIERNQEANKMPKLYEE
jgi:hypothetical protein